jgi:hypothetical protein
MYEEIGRRDRLGVYRKLAEEPYTGLLRALVENKPSLVWGRYGNSVAALPKADKGALLSALARHRIEEAVTCPPGDCYVAELAGLGTVELITRGQSVLRLRASLTLRADHSEADIEGLAALAALLLAAGVRQSELERVIVGMRLPIRECLFGTTLLALDEASVLATSVDHKGKLFIDVHAPAPLP